VFGAPTREQMTDVLVGPEMAELSVILNSDWVSPETIAAASAKFSSPGS
jgi:hypothetical protein